MATTQPAGIRRKLRRVLKEAFPGAEVKLESYGADKVGGSLIWRGFLGKDPVDRQHNLEEVLNAGLDADEKTRVRMIFTFTPYEVAVIDREVNGRRRRK